jgi:hypothetical protein
LVIVRLPAGLGSVARTLDRFVADVDLFASEPPHRIGEGAAQQRFDLARRQGFEHVDARPREQWRDHFKRRVLRRRADEDNVSGFYVRQERILLRLVEAVHFIYEDNGPSSRPPGVLGRGHHILDFLDTGQDRAEGHEFGVSQSRHEARQRRFPAARRSPKNHRADVVMFDLDPQRLAWTHQRCLPCEFIERARAHAFRERLGCS